MLLDYYLFYLKGKGISVQFSIFCHLFDVDMLLYVLECLSTNMYGFVMVTDKDMCFSGLWKKLHFYSVWQQILPLFFIVH